MKSAFVAGVAGMVAVSAQAGISTDWNLIVRNDLVFSSSEIDGSAIIGGNLLGGTSNYSIQGVTAANGDGLAIGGTLAAGVTVNINNAGNLRVTSLANVLGTANLNGGSTIVDAGIGATVSNLFAQAEAASTFLSGLASNGTVDGAGNLNASPAVIDGQNVAVYTITQAQWDGLGQLNLNVGSADSVIINFIAGAGGVADLTAPPNLVGGFTQANSSRILWNFADATSVIVNNNFNGALLAPDASLSLNGGGINGTVIVDSIAVQDAEIRRNIYTGFIPAPSAMAAFALMGLVSNRRRRSA